MRVAQGSNAVKTHPHLPLTEKLVQEPLSVAFFFLYSYTCVEYTHKVVVLSNNSLYMFSAHPYSYSYGS